MVINGQYEITSISDRSSVNTAINRAEPVAAPSRVAGDNGFESNIKPSTYHAEMSGRVQAGSPQASGSQEYQSNTYTRQQVLEKRSQASRLSRESGSGPQNGQTPASMEDSTVRMEISRQVQRLQQAEREVIAHEQAHMSVGGPYAGSATYSYTEGPDGKRYVTGGEVSIHAPAGKDAEETARIMNQVKRAALAPANPSSQDMKVAARAAAAEQAALREQAIDKSLEASEALRQDIQSNYKERLEERDSDISSQTKAEDVTAGHNEMRLHRQAQIAENQLRAEERNLDAVEIEEGAVQQDYERKLLAYQHIMQQVENFKSNNNPAVRAVNMVA